MNSKNLIVSFITVSVAALIVSAIAVISVARTYSTMLKEDTPSQTVSIREIADSSSSPTSSPETASIPETTSVPETEETTEKDIEEESTITESVEPPISEQTAADTSVPETNPGNDENFTLTFSSDRLIISDGSGKHLYERIIDASSLHPKDTEVLLVGISFPDFESAMSAVYDLIS